MTYDAAGNLASKTDFNGRTTTYAYDAANRLLTQDARSEPRPAHGQLHLHRHRPARDA